jgi:hypothetical protein
VLPEELELVPLDEPLLVEPPPLEEAPLEEPVLDEPLLVEPPLEVEPLEVEPLNVDSPLDEPPLVEGLLLVDSPLDEPWLDVPLLVEPPSVELLLEVVAAVVLPTDVAVLVAVLLLEPALEVSEPEPQAATASDAIRASPCRETKVLVRNPPHHAPWSLLSRRLRGNLTASEAITVNCVQGLQSAATPCEVP